MENVATETTNKTVHFVVKKVEPFIRVTGIANMHLYEFENTLKNPPHNHYVNELVYVNKGQISINSGSFSGKLGKGDLYIHKKSSVHSLTGINDNISLVIISFSTEPDCIDAISEQPIAITREERKLVSDIIREGRNVFSPPYKVPTENMKKKKNPVVGCEQMFSLLLEQLLIKLVRRITNHDRPQIDWLQPAMSVSGVVKYIDENFLEKITINDLVVMFNTNRSTVCKKFKQKTGKTLNRYIADKKVALAKKLIVGTDKSFTEIAEEMKFETIQDFSHFFVKNTGCSPSDYRKKHKKTP